MDGRLKDMLEMIPEGKADSISRKDLRLQLHVSDRILRRMLHEARQVYPILSNTGKGGYYYPASKEEAEAYIRQINSYIRELNKTLPPVKRYIEAKGQRRLDFEYFGQGFGEDHPGKQKDDRGIYDTGPVSQMALEAVFASVF